MKNSISKKIMDLSNFLRTPRIAEDLQKELKVKQGYNFKLQDIRVNLLYLLRRGQIQRQKEGSLYKYYLEGS